jgi:cytochrome c peroxidase
MPLTRGAFVVVLGLVLTACSRGSSRTQLDDDNPITPTALPPYGMEEFFAASSQPDPARVRLGRWLFYDTRLSSDRTVSCATCHRPEFAFSDTQPVAMGIGGQLGRRKTPSLINLGARTLLPGTERDPGHVFFWDGRASSLEQQVMAPIADSKEMGFGHDALLLRLSEIEGYRPFFNDTFGSTAITLDRIAAALADYVRMRRSGNAPYDRWSYGRDGRAMSEEAQRGSEIFFFNGGCATCHAGFNFSDGLFHNIGIGWDAGAKAFSDAGRAAITHDPRDRGAFKTPGLRDVEKHPPYMHDGSLATLRDVVEFYNRGGNQVPGQSARLRRLGLSPSDVDAVVAFLRTLSGEGYHDRPPRFFPR